MGQNSTFLLAFKVVLVINTGLHLKIKMKNEESIEM